MISTPPADTIRVASPETSIGVKKDEESDDSFSEILSDLSGISKGVSVKAEASEETDSGKSEEREASDLSCMAVLVQLYERLGTLEPNADAEQKKAIASAQAAITDILEGNGVSGNTDIAALLTGERMPLGSKEKETIQARMPQILEMAQGPGSAAKEDDVQLCRNLCPLENSSEQTQNQIQTVAISGMDSAEENEAAVTPSPLEESADTVLRKEESAQSNQSGDAAKDTGMKEDKTELKKADQPDTPSHSIPRMEDQSVSVSAPENFAAGTREPIGGAARKLMDILSSYDEMKTNQFEIQLEPEKLGKLSITLSMEPDGLKAIIRTKDAQVQSLLTSEISALAEKLSENGVQIKRLDVVCSDPGDRQLGSRENGNSDPRQNSGTPWRRHSLKMQSAYDVSDSTQVYVSDYEDVIGSTVSYRV